jgi:phenylpyruvate tautomerase PptA (4-oxalocrotonate tautomerase family)
MPHVTVKLWPGKSEQQKARLSVAIVKDVMNVLNYGEESVSVAIEEVKPEDCWCCLGHRSGDRQSLRGGGSCSSAGGRPRECGSLCSRRTSLGRAYGDRCHLRCG